MRPAPPLAYLPHAASTRLSPRRQLAAGVAGDQVGDEVLLRLPGERGEHLTASLQLFRMARLPGERGEHSATSFQHFGYCVEVLRFPFRLVVGQRQRFLPYATDPTFVVFLNHLNIRKTSLQ